VVRRGEGERMKEQKVADFRAAMAWLMQQAEGAWAASATRAWAR
jgi:DNA gyrase subunit B